MLMIVFFSSQVPIQEIYESFALENLVMMNNKKEKIGWPQMINWILKVLLKNKCQNGLQKIFWKGFKDRLQILFSILRKFKQIN